MLQPDGVQTSHLCASSSDLLTQTFPGLACLSKTPPVHSLSTFTREVPLAADSMKLEG